MAKSMRRLSPERASIPVARGTPAKKGDRSGAVAPTAARDHPESRPPRWQPAVVGAVLFLLVAGLYVPTLGNGVTNWDDPRYVGGHPFASRGLAGILSAWLGTHDDAWYPLTQTIYCLIQAVAGPSPFAHHLVQVLVFAAAVALVPRALGAFGVPRRLGFWAALLWAAHPMRVDTVSWAANLNDALSALGTVGAFALYGSGCKRASAWAFAAGLLSKSRVFPLALLFPLLERRPGEPWGRVLGRSAAWLVPAAAVAVISAAIHLGVPDSGRTMPGGNLVGAVPSAVWLPWWYLGRTILVSAPQVIYSYEPVRWLDVRLALGLLLWLGAIVVVRRLGRREGYFALAGFALPFATVTGLVPLMYPLADRYALFPSLVVTVLVVFLVERWLRPVAWGRIALVGLLATGTVFLVIRDIDRQRDWRDSIALWEADRERNPTSADVRIGLSGAYGAAGRWDDALREIEEVARLAPDRETNAADRFLAHLGKAGADSGLAIALDREFRRAPRRPEVLLALAGEALRAGYPEAARVAATAAAKLRESAAAHAALARIEVVAGNFAAALEHADRALALDPAEEPVVVTRAIALANLKRWDEALATTERPLADGEQRALLAATRAMVLSATGREEEARRVLEGVRERLGAVVGPP
jgi:Flp pilus assembly protein TadD